MSAKSLAVWLFVATLCFAFALNVFTSSRARKDEINSCQRNNVSRQVIYDFLRSAEKARAKEAAAATDPALKASNQRTAEQYRRNAEKLLKAAMPVAEHPGSPQVNCDQAFPARIGF